MLGKDTLVPWERARGRSLAQEAMAPLPQASHSGATLVQERR
jgi:hypothetical protein